MRRKNRHAITLAGKREIANECAGSGRESLILDPADGLSDSKFRHGVPSSHFFVVRRHN
jgi:hypothetical protein